MADLTEDQMTEMAMELGERALTSLVGLFTKLRESDRAAGATHDEAALGGVAMAAEALPHNDLILLAALAARRIADAQEASDA